MHQYLENVLFFVFLLEVFFFFFFFFYMQMMFGCKKTPVLFHEPSSFLAGDGSINIVCIPEVATCLSALLDENLESCCLKTVANIYFSMNLYFLYVKHTHPQGLKKYK